ncbi:hypothetical protein [Fictibacillus sp. KU28468]|uniref:hypothetical protein n=1 Tax=Fictibacillus sp. KU28468 TaxID=2991053 RepID=UPI00223D5914|nr:hypothetical protein [Fictibacillus sp. KU28468]UZJ77707.1 hypothetical protein OKX00_16250 [Fictibacillus sp. KU28468]
MKGNDRSRIRPVRDEYPYCITRERESMDREGTTNPGDIALKEGYRIEAAVKGLQHPISLLFTARGRLIVGEAGVATGSGRVIEVTRQGNKVIGQGTATNSGVVGKDSGCLKEFRYFHDYPGQDITLNGQNFKV